MLVIAPVVMLGIFAAPIEVRGWLYVPVFLVMAGIVALLLGVRPGPKIKIICQKLGAMSYPLYAVHWLTLYLFSAAAARIFRGALPYGAVVVAHILIAPLIAYVLAMTYELWARKALMRTLLRSTVALGRDRAPADPEGEVVGN
jgi:peptidoglycan/LPS O-acetylase OafA/YrhL